MTAVALVVALLALAVVALALVARRLAKPASRRDQAIEAVTRLAQQELRDWSRRHSEREPPR
jgi:hypothetical protein